MRPAGWDEPGLQEGLDLIRATWEVQRWGDVVGREVELDLDGVAVGGADHVAADLVPALGVGLRDRPEVVGPQPVVPLLVPLLELADDVLDVDPPVDVHLEVELLGRVAQDEGQSPGHAVPLARPHDELPLVVASGA